MAGKNSSSLLTSGSVEEDSLRRHVHSSPQIHFKFDDQIDYFGNSESVDASPTAKQITLDDYESGMSPHGQSVEQSHAAFLAAFNDSHRREESYRASPFSIGNSQDWQIEYVHSSRDLLVEKSPRDETKNWLYDLFFKKGENLVEMVQTSTAVEPEYNVGESLKKPKKSQNTLESASNSLKTTCDPKLYPETLPDIPYYNAETLQEELEKLKIKIDDI